MKANYPLYVIAALLIFIPTWFALRNEIIYSSSFITMVIDAVLLLFIIGKLVTIREKKRENQPIARDVGIVLGLLALFIVRVYL